VQPVLFDSRVVIQRSCTTAVEAGLANAPTLSPQWVAPPFLMPVAEAVSVPCSDYTQLAGIVRDILEDRYVPSPSLTGAIDSMTRDWFHAIDGRAHLRVAEAIMRALPPTSGRRSPSARTRLYQYDETGAPLTGLKALGGRIRRAAKLSPDWSFHRVRTVPRDGWTRTRKHYDAEQVQHVADRCLQRLRAAMDGVPSVTAAQARDRGEYVAPGFGHSVTMAAGR
jgi:hypothetical protein